MHADVVPEVTQREPNALAEAVESADKQQDAHDSSVQSQTEMGAALASFLRAPGTSEPDNAVGQADHGVRTRGQEMTGVRWYPALALPADTFTRAGRSTAAQLLM
ncbi:hypothetical protein Q0Z83_111020 [Actinoplanes sichuanensis]|nr:hypothetical protein Q0Z83_111020 [Actinoplanes sichuanensis]